MRRFFLLLCWVLFFFGRKLLIREKMPGFFSDASFFSLCSKPRFRLDLAKGCVDDAGLGGFRSSSIDEPRVGGPRPFIWSSCAKNAGLGKGAAFAGVLVVSVDC